MQIVDVPSVGTRLMAMYDDEMYQRFLQKKTCEGGSFLPLTTTRLSVFLWSGRVVDVFGSAVASAASRDVNCREGSTRNTVEHVCAALPYGSVPQVVRPCCAGGVPSDDAGGNLRGGLRSRCTLSLQLCSLARASRLWVPLPSRAQVKQLAWEGCVAAVGRVLPVLLLWVGSPKCPRVV